MKKFSIAAGTACAAILLLLYLSGCEDIVTPPEVYAPSSATATIGVAGGAVSLKDNGGFTITLTFPYGALASDTIITLRSLGTSHGGPFGHMLYPGLEIDPADLLLEYPARLEIQCPPGTAITSGSLLYCCWTDALMAPLEDLLVDPGGPTIGGNLYLLSRYAIATPTTAEMQSQLNVWAGSDTSSRSRFTALSSAAGACPPDGYGWQGFKTKTSGMLAWVAAFTSLDSPAGDQGAADAQAIIEDMVTDTIMEFSTLAPPFNPCGSYIRAALRYFSSAQKLGVNNAVVDELYEDIGGLVDQCKVQFTYRYDSESRFESDASNMSQSVTTSGYAAVNCSVSYWDLADGAAACAISGDGAGEYTSSARTDYKNTEKDVATVETSEEMTYTCSGTAGWDESERVFKASVVIAGEGSRNTVICDSRNDTPCQTLDENVSSRKTLSDIPLISGYTLTDSTTDNPALGTVSVVEQITSADAFQPENPDPDGHCY